MTMRIPTPSGSFWLDWPLVESWAEKHGTTMAALCKSDLWMHIRKWLLIVGWILLFGAIIGVTWKLIHGDGIVSALLDPIILLALLPLIWIEVVYKNRPSKKYMRFRDDMGKLRKKLNLQDDIPYDMGTLRRRIEIRLRASSNLSDFT